MSDSAWLIEAAGPKYWTGKGRFTEDVNDACRFARFIDAEVVRCYLLPDTARELSVCREHLWMPQRDLTARAEAPPETGHTAEIEIRRTLWLGHGHNGPALYGDDGEMQCKACHKEWDYRRADLSVLAHQALAALKAEVQRLTAELRAQQERQP